jgi:hypothetical protein
MVSATDAHTACNLGFLDRVKYNNNVLQSILRSVSRESCYVTFIFSMHNYSVTDLNSEFRFRIASCDVKCTCNTTVLFWVL